MSLTGDPDVLVLVHNFSWESVKGQLSVLHLGGDWLLLPQALLYMRLAHPGPYLCTPARMPQARPCWPMRSGRQGDRQRCHHAWLHTPPSRLAGGLGLPGCVGALGALCQASCEALGPALRLWKSAGGEAFAGSLASSGVPSLWALAVWCCSRRPVIRRKKRGRA